MGKALTVGNRSIAWQVHAAGIVLLGLVLPLSLVAVEIVSAFLLLLFAYRLVHGEKIALSWWDLPVAAFILIRLGGVLFSPHPELVSKGLLNLSFCLAYLFTAFSPNFGQADVNWRAFVRMLVLAGAAASIAGVFQAAIGVPRSSGFYGGYTLMGSLTGIAIVLGLYHIAAGGLFRSSALNAILLILNAIGLAVSQCRAEWVAAMVVLLPLCRYFYPRQSVFTSIIVLGFFFVVMPLRERLMTFTDPLSNLSGREIIWRVAPGVIAERPIFGHGLNSFVQAFPEQFKTFLSVTGVGDWHNVYLQVAVESGFVGLSAFLWMLMMGFYLAWRGLRRAKGRIETARAWSLIAALCFFCLAGFLDVFLVRISAVVPMFMILGMIVRQEKEYENRSEA